MHSFVGMHHSGNSLSNKMKWRHDSFVGMHHSGNSLGCSSAAALLLHASMCVGFRVVSSFSTLCSSSRSHITLCLPASSFSSQSVATCGAGDTFHRHQRAPFYPQIRSPLLALRGGNFVSTPAQGADDSSSLTWIRFIHRSRSSIVSWLGLERFGGWGRPENSILAENKDDAASRSYSVYHTSNRLGSSVTSVKRWHGSTGAVADGAATAACSVRLLKRRRFSGTNLHAHDTDSPREQEQEQEPPQLCSTDANTSKALTNALDRRQQMRDMDGNSTDGSTSKALSHAGGVAQENDEARTGDIPSRLDSSVRARLRQDVRILALRLPARRCGAAMEDLKEFVLRLPKTKAVIPDPSPERFGTKLVLIQPDDKVQSGSGVPEKVSRFAQENGGEVIGWEVTIGYEQLNAAQVLAKLLPPHLEVPSAFEQVGHIAHLNLRDELRGYGRLIGEVVLDKNPHIRTVVNKLNRIENPFRVLDMEIIAGVDSFVTEVRQRGLTYHLDYSKVYWNSRLEYEHELMIKSLEAGEEVWDMFCGIGPFAVPAALKGCKVHANDLNPHSYAWCLKNVGVNVPAALQENVVCYNLDARAFIRERVRHHEQAQPAHTASASARVHVIANLPASAPEFMDAFAGVFSQGKWLGGLPIVHLYAFSKHADAKSEVLERASAALGTRILSHTASCREVRLVAPGKVMVCLSFTLPQEVLC